MTTTMNRREQEDLKVLCLFIIVDFLFFLLSFLFLLLSSSFFFLSSFFLAFLFLSSFFFFFFSSSSRSLARSSSAAGSNNTWGVSVIRVNNTYHGYMTEIANRCLLGDYGMASQVVHLTAPTPLGPFTRHGVVLVGFAHNPQAVVAADGRVVLFHIGAPLAPGCLAACSANGTVQPRPAHCAHGPDTNHGVSVAVAASPAGPFQRYPYIFEAGANSTSATNPAPLLLANGTLVVAVRRATAPTQPLFVGHIDSPQGPWRRLDVPVYATAAASPATFEEDPFLFQTARGFHMLTHRAVLRTAQVAGPPPLGPWLCGGGHLYSPDLLAWYEGENVYNHSAGDAAQCGIVLAGSGAANLTSRQRPTLLFDGATMTHLYSGASVGVSEYVRSFTLVQPLHTAAVEAIQYTVCAVSATNRSLALPWANVTVSNCPSCSPQSVLADATGCASIQGPGGPVAATVWARQYNASVVTLAAAGRTTAALTPRPIPGFPAHSWRFEGWVGE